MKFNEAEHNKRTDKGTMFLILVTSIIGHIGSIIEWAYFPQIDLKFLSFIGAGLLIFGIIFRVVAIRSLKNAFSNTIQIKEGQKLFDKGLYSKFRHPFICGRCFVVSELFRNCYIRVWYVPRLYETYIS